MIRSRFLSMLPRTLSVLSTRAAARCLGTLTLLLALGIGLAQPVWAQAPQKVIDQCSSCFFNGMYAADLDGDGDADVLSASFDESEIAWYENQVGESGADSTGFGPQKTITINATFAKSVFAADIDGDGDPDVLASYSERSDRGDGRVAWYENQVGESGADSDGFGAGQLIHAETRDLIESVRAADIDGDGDPDAVTDAGDAVYWYENQVGESGADSDGFGDRKTITTDANGAETVAAVDVDGDGDPDVLSVSVDNNKIAWYENQVGESGADSDGFGSQQTITTSAEGAQSFHTADLDGDGDPDVLSTADNDSTIAWYENQVGESGADSDGFGVQQAIATNLDGAESIHTADLDQDADADILSAFNFDNKITWYENQLGESGADSDGFGSQQGLNTNAGSPSRLLAEDLDEDGDTDVLSAGLDKIAWYENATGVLPVELAGFDAQVDGDAVRLTWQTASEQNNAGFRVERRVSDASAPGVRRVSDASAPGARRVGERERGGVGAWTRVGFVDGVGTTSEAQSYRFTDAQVPYEAGAVTYRLTQVDTDGATHRSGTVTVERGVAELQLLGTSPNPARQQATVRYALPQRQDVAMQLYDVLGRQVRTVVSSEKEGRHEQSIDVSGLSSGVYFLRLTAGGQTRTQKVTVVR